MTKMAEYYDVEGKGKVYAKDEAQVREKYGEDAKITPSTPPKTYATGKARSPTTPAESIPGPESEIDFKTYSPVTSIKEALIIPPGKERTEALRKSALEFQTYHAGKTFTPSEYFQEITEVKREASKGYSEYQTMLESIEPETSYRWTDPTTGIESTMIGRTLVGKLEKTYGGQFREQEQRLQTAWSQARDIPKGTIITKTPSGYTLKLRDTSLDWSKREIEKIKTLRREGVEKLKSPDIGRALVGGVQKLGSEVAMFGFTAVSGFAALGKPAADVAAKGMGVKTLPVHYISAFDIAFEPIGWSPKGSVDLIKETGLSGWAGMAASETLQVAAMTQIFKPISTGVKIGVKGLVKRVPVVYGKFTKVFPEEKLVSSVAGKATKVTFRPVLGGERVAGTVYRWGALGYRKGLELTSAGVKTSKKITEGATSELYKVSQKTVYGRGAIKRIWLSPAKFAKAEQKLASKLAMKKIIERGYRADIRAGFGTARELIEKTKYKLNWTGKRLVKKYKYTTETWRVGEDIPSLFKTYKVGKYGGFERFALEGAKEPIVSQGWYQAVKEMYTKGYTRVIPTETGFVLDVSKGFGTSGTRPIAKKWITRYRPPFLENIQGQISAPLSQLKTTLTSPSKTMFGRAGLIDELSRVTIPSSMYKSVYETGLELGLLGMVKTISAKKTRYDIKPELITLQRTRQYPAFKMAQTPISDILTTPAMVQMSRVDFKPAFDVVTVPDLVQKQLYKMDVPQPPSRSQFISIPAPGFSVPLFPPLKLYGRGRKGVDFGLFGKIKGFRMADIWRPLGIKI